AAFDQRLQRADQSRRRPRQPLRAAVCAAEHRAGDRLDDDVVCLRVRHRAKSFLSRLRPREPVRPRIGAEGRCGGHRRRRRRAGDALRPRAGEGPMTDMKTAEQHTKSLKDGRTVYIDGELVADVTEHPAFRNAVLAAAELYDFQAQPDNVELMTFQPDGSNRRVNRGWQMPRNYAELVQRRKALQAWAALSCGLCGRSPDHLSSSLVGQRMGIEVFRKHGAARAKAVEDFFDYARHNDLYVTNSI